MSVLPVNSSYEKSENGRVEPPHEKSANDQMKFIFEQSVKQWLRQVQYHVNTGSFDSEQPIHQLIQHIPDQLCSISPKMGEIVTALKQMEVTGTIWNPELSSKIGEVLTRLEKGI